MYLDQFTSSEHLTFLQMCEKDVCHTRKVSFKGVKDEQKIGEGKSRQCWPVKSLNPALQPYQADLAHTHMYASVTSPTLKLLEYFRHIYVVRPYPEVMWCQYNLCLILHKEEWNLVEKCRISFCGMTALKLNQPQAWFNALSWFKTMSGPCSAWYIKKCIIDISNICHIDMA